MRLPSPGTVIYLLVMCALTIGCDEDETAQRICMSNLECRSGLICYGGGCVPVTTLDEDGDGIPDHIEIDLGTDPTRRDSDGDGLTDDEELEFDEGSRRWRAPDQDEDGVPDALEGDDADSDDDGVPDALDPCDDDPNCPVEGGAHPPCLMLVDQPCVVGIGDCADVGVTVCTPDGMDVFCNGEPLAEQGEACDQRDNDCDGQTDEDFPEVGDACRSGQGECTTMGTWACDDSAGVVCVAEAIQPSEERCDGLDNDCDGQVDEAFPDLGGECVQGEGECAGTGIIVCDPETLLSVCERPESPELEERCDGLDNDCDGSVDEPFPSVGDPCMGGQGACATAGVIRCSADGSEIVCDAPTPEPTEELCNLIDDDCDGMADEGFLGLGTPCSAGEGVCASDGELVCSLDGLTTTCTAQGGMAVPERCDNRDNDCDGTVDEDFDIGTQCTSGQGECQVAGLRICDPASGLLRCDARPSPVQAERCDGLDNDCDGTTDETFPDLGQACELGQGECRGMGIRRCSEGGQATICGANPDPLAAELCDGLDNDCDGQIDERLGLGEPCGAGQGACASEGIMACADDGTVRCNAVVPEGGPELCDGLDNDCDLTIDEGFEEVGQLCLVGRGICAASGEWRCAVDGLSVTCDAEEGEPQPERCDGVDNDCDGAFDEAFDDLGFRCTAGRGVCERVGRRECAEDGLSTVCPAEAAAGSPEICNLFDDDCDGNVDETFEGLGDPCSEGIGACRADGRFICSDNQDEVICEARAGEPVPETCGGTDDDCDGTIDEDFVDDCEFRAIALGSASYETCVVTPSGHIRCWGDAEGASPGGLFRSLESGDDFHCAVNAENRAECWGARNDRRLEIPDVPVAEMALGLGGHGCMITVDGATRCWGRDRAGETEAPEVPLTRVSAGLEFSCGLRTADGVPVCWGSPDFNVRAAPDLALVALDSGVSATCGIRVVDGGLSCWGEEIAGQLDAPEGVFSAVSVGGYFGCAINDARALRCWGLDQHGQIQAPPGEYTAVSAGAAHVCALTVNGGTRCWGAGDPDDGDGFPNAQQASPPR